MTELTLESLRSDIFANVQAKQGELILTFHTIGQRYAIKVDGGLARTSEYGEKLTVRIGQKVRIASRNLTVTIEPLPHGFDAYGFEITTQAEMRMHGKGVIGNKAFAVLLPGSAKEDDDYLTPREFWLIPPDINELSEVINQ